MCFENCVAEMMGSLFEVILNFDLITLVGSFVNCCLNG